MIIKNINLTIQEGPVKENQQTLNLHIRFLEREIKKVNQPEITN